MARKKFSCDFETTTKLDDCRVWGYGTMEIGNNENFTLGNNIDDFLQWAEKTEGDLYFHNLKFDGEFIVNRLLQLGWKHSDSGLPKTFDTLISNMGQWYMVSISYGYDKNGKKRHTRIYDSLKKLPFSVDAIGRSYGLSVEKLDVEEGFYDRERPIGHEITEEEVAYIKNDVEVVAQALDIQFKEGLKRMTNGSDALGNFREIFGTKTFRRMFPVLSLEDNEEIRMAYKGGFTWLNDKYKEKEIKKGLVYDVNSLYPSQMYYRPLPYGTPIKFAGEYVKDKEYPLWTQHIKTMFELKEGYIPTIQIKNSLFFKGNEYLKNSSGELVDLYLSNIDLELFFEHYNIIEIEYVGGWKFKQATGLFNKYIDKWTHIRHAHTGAREQIAKLMLNSLYGKFATNPDMTGKVPYLKEDNSTGFKEGEPETADPVYTPMGVFITAWARYTTITTAQSVYDRIIYCDTDSIHIEGGEQPKELEGKIHPKKLGYWDFEGKFDRAKFLRQKTYVQEIGGKLEVTCAGMPDRVKEKVTFDNFKVGFQESGKLMPKHVDGGIVLVDTDFSIK